MLARARLADVPPDPLSAFVLRILAAACFAWSSREPDAIRSMFARGTGEMLVLAAAGDVCAAAYLGA